MELKPMLNRDGHAWTLDLAVYTPNAEHPNVTLRMVCQPMEEPTLELYDDGSCWLLLTEEAKQERITGIVGQRMCSRDEAENTLYSEMDIRMIDPASESYGVDFHKIRQQMLDWWKAINVMINLAS